MASQGQKDEDWLSKEDSLMYSISRLAMEGHDVSVGALTESSAPRTYERDGYPMLLFPVDVRGQKYGSQTSRALLSHLQEDPPDILYLNSLNMVMNRIIQDAMAESKTVLRAHGKMIHDFLVEDVDALEVSNEWQRWEATESFLVDEKRVWLNPFGANTTLFKPQPDAVKEHDVAYVGRLVKGKNIELLFRAFRNIDGSLLLIGKGPDEGHYHELAKKMGIESKVTFQGWVDHPGMVTHLNRCKIFAMPSLSEGGGRAVAEAMACGLPVIAMKGARGSEAYVEHGRSGFIVRPSGFVDAVSQLLKNGEMRVEFGRRGCELAVSRYSSESFHKKLRALIESLMTMEGSGERGEKRPAFYMKRLFRINYWVALLKRRKNRRIVKTFEG
jgi:glycosyltransferase involved in cell wall biosynthesis